MIFDLYPAIDLRAGQVVRLRQGDPGRQTTYDPRPRAVARRWIDAGARWLHVVNLDGAFGERDQANQQALAAILEEVGRRAPGARVQLGGGLRSMPQISAVVEMGVQRLILGTAAIENTGLVAQAVELFGAERIVAGIDARDGQVLVRGWGQKTGQDFIDLGTQLARLGLQTAIFTNVHRDGMGSGLDVGGAQQLAEATGLQVIASGGVDSLDDLRAAREAGLAGAVIGRALYEGRFSLEEALKC